MYVNCGDLNSSRSIFEGLVNKTSVTWSAMVAANAQQGYGEEALKVLLEMQRAKVDFDQYSLSASLAVSADLASLEEGKQLHGLAIKLGFHEKAMKTFHDMLKYGSKPDHVTFVSLLSACSHGGLVDEGLAYFATMTLNFGVLPGIEHCVCIVDLLGRSGRHAEAEGFIEKMPVPPNDFIWRSLLAACRIHENVDVGERAAKHLLESDPSDDSAYVLYSNVCAASKKWQDAQNVWVEMESNRVKKQPACSWVKTET